MSTLFKILSTFVLIAFASLGIACKNQQSSIASTTSHQSNTNTETPTSPMAYPVEPGTCMMQAYVLNIYLTNKDENQEPCKSYPCVADVVITQWRSCGYGVENKPHEGDTIKVKFIYSLVPSDEFNKVYPARVYLPGLTVNTAFEARVHIKNDLQAPIRYEVGNYEILR